MTSQGYAEGAGTHLDWYNDRLQILVHDQQDDAALHVRYNQDGTIAEILVRDDLMEKVRCEGSLVTGDWQKERDGE